MKKSEEVYLNWLNNILDKKIKKQLKKLKKEQVLSNFAESLHFGTAGMRGTMESGTNNINQLTVTKLAQSLSLYMQQNNQKSVVICFDTRKNSKQFAELFAKVLDKNKIKVYMFKKFAPTPLCVFATTKYKADFGVMITASHNNKTYNGIKIYGDLGIQINKDVQEEISNIFDKINEIDVYNDIYKHKLSKNVSVLSSKEIDDFTVSPQDKNRKNLKIVYTPLNGTGKRAVTKLLKQNGFMYKIPTKQKNASGDFKTCPYPNPEFVEAFNESLILAKKCDADIIVATDPDADRMGVMVKHNGEYIKLSGNEVGYIFAENALCKNTNENKFVVTSVVSSPLIDLICNKHNAKLFKTLTGFMSLGTKDYELQKKYGENAFCLCYEESCGYVVKNSYYDKDGIYATLLICNIAETLKKQNKTLIDFLNEIYNKYGYMATIGDSVKFDGNNSFLKMQKIVNNLRQNKSDSILNEKITKVIDYQTENTGLDKQNFIEYRAKDIIFIIRPSGTEPKLKIYLFVKGEKETANLKAQKALKEIKTKLLKWTKK